MIITTISLMAKGHKIGNKVKKFLKECDDCYLLSSSARGNIIQQFTTGKRIPEGLFWF